MSNIRLNVNNFNVNYLDIEIYKSIKDFCHVFTAQINYTQLKTANIKGNELVEIFLNEQLYFTGYIEQIDINETAGQRDVTISGRSKCADILDSNITRFGQITSKMPFKNIINAILSSLEIENVEVIDNVSLEIVNVNDRFALRNTETAFSFLDKIAAHYGVLLIQDEKGNIVITRGGTKTADFTIRHLQNDNRNNVISRKIRYDLKNIFGKYLVTSENPATLQQSYYYSKPAIDSRSRQSRTLVINSPTNMSINQCTKRAEWEKRRRSANALNYEVRINLESIKTVAEINTLVKIEEYVDLFNIESSNMLIEGITVKSGKDGSVVDLQLNDLKNYQL